MARFTFTIESEEEKEMSGLMVRLFAHGSPPAARSPATVVPQASTLTHPDDDEKEEAPQPEPVRRTRRTKAEMEAAAKAEVDTEAEIGAFLDDDGKPSEVTLDMVKAAGSKAMSAIKASGVAAIFASHGGGAESFGSLKPEHYAAVHEALVTANG